MEPTAADRAWEDRYRKWEEEENARNAREDAAILRSGGKLPGTWTPESAALFTNPGVGFYNAREDASSGMGGDNAYQPPEQRDYARAIAEYDRQQADMQKYQGLMAKDNPYAPVETPTVASRLSELVKFFTGPETADMVPAHAIAPGETPMIPSHTPGSPYKETSLRNYTQDDYNVGHGVGADTRGIEKPYRTIGDITGKIRDYIGGADSNMPGVFSRPQGGGVVTKEASPGLESRFGDEMTLAMALMTAGAAPGLIRGAAGLGGIPKEAVMERLGKIGVNEANIGQRMPGLAKKLEGGWLQKILGGSEVYPKNLRAYAGAETRKANAAKLNPSVQAALKAMQNTPVAPTPLDAVATTLKQLAAQKTTKSFVPYQINQATHTAGPTNPSPAPSFWQYLNELVPLYNDTPFGLVGP